MNHWASGLNDGEALYGKRGSQSGMISTYVAKEMKIDPNSRFHNKHMYLYHKLQSDDELTKVFKARPLNIYSKTPYFSMTDRATGKRQPFLVSLPMYAIYSGLKSVKDIRYERLIMRPESENSLDSITENIKRHLSQFELLMLRIQTESKPNLKQIDHTVQSIFMLIIVITMALCLFSLSSTMAANI